MQKKSGLINVFNVLRANALILFVSLLTGVITARLLGAEGRGEMAAILYWPQLLSYVLTIGLPSALIYNLRTRPNEAGNQISVVMWVGVLLGVIAVGMGIILIPVWLSQYNDEVINFSLCAMAVAPLALVGLMLLAVAQSQSDLKIYNRVRYGSPIIALCMLLLVVIWSDLTPFTAAICFLASGVIVNLFLVVWAWNKYKPRVIGSVVVLKSMLSYGIRSWGLDVFKVFFSHIDRMIVLFFLDAKAMGLYVTALSLSQVLNIIPNGISAVLFPKASGQEEKAVLDLTCQAVRLGLVAALLAGLPLLLVGPFLIEILYGEEFLGATNVFRVLVASLIVNSLALLLEQAFMAVGKPGRVSAIQFIVFLFGIPVLIWLVQEFGIEGAGLGLLTIALMRIILIYRFISVSMGMPVPSLIPRISEIKQQIRRIKNHIITT